MWELTMSDSCWCRSNPRVKALVLRDAHDVEPTFAELCCVSGSFGSGYASRQPQSQAPNHLSLRSWQVAVLQTSATSPQLSTFLVCLPQIILSKDLQVRSAAGETNLE